MAVSSGPDVVDSGLVLALDAADINSFDKYENLALNSESINSWANNGNAISISANSQIAPDGTLTADVLSQTAVTGASRWVSSTTRTYTAGVTYTLSIWLKKISGTDAQPTINLWVNGGTQQSVGTITTEWVRYSKSFTPVSTISSNTFTGLNVGWNDQGAANNFTFAAWGFQVEIGSSVTDYYRTTSTTKTRGSTIIDLSGNGNTGTLTNGPTYSSANGGSIVFDGTDDYVSLGTSLTNNFINITVSCWVYVVNDTGRQDIVTKYPFGNGWFLYYINTSNKFGVDGREDGSLYINLTSTNTFSINNWYHIVFTKQASNWKLYVNSQLENDTIIGSGTISFNNNGILAIGALPVNNDYGKNRVAQVQIYNRALSAAEIQQNFNSTRSRFGI